MAYVNSRSVSLSISDRITALVKQFKDAMARRQLYTQTLFELNSLSDRDLTDLGVHRSDITALAREAAYGK